MIITVRIPAEPGTVFGKDAFDSVIGDVTSVTHMSVETPAKILDAKVYEDGVAVDLTLEVLEEL